MTVVRDTKVRWTPLLSKALAAGASALLTERKLEGFSPQLVVADVLQASGRFGCLKRQAFEGDVIAITGSAGKTTTKNLVAAALATAGEVHATVGNQIMSWVYRSRCQG